MYATATISTMLIDNAKAELGTSPSSPRNARQVPIVSVLIALVFASCVGPMGRLHGGRWEEGCFLVSADHERASAEWPALANPIPNRASIVGIVTDRGSGFAERDARIVVTNLVGGAVADTRTSSRGGFTFDSLVPGEYEIFVVRAMHNAIRDTLSVVGEAQVRLHFELQAVTECR